MACVVLISSGRRKEVLDLVFERLLFWLMWCLFVNGLLGKRKGFYDESSLLSLTLFGVKLSFHSCDENLLFSFEFWLPKSCLKRVLLCVLG